MKTPLESIACVLLASVLGAAGQFLFATAADRSAPGLVGFVTSPWVILGSATYVTVMVLFTRAFRLGGTVAALYPIYATTFIWAALYGWAFRSEPLRGIHVLGMALLVAGMVCLGAGRGAPEASG